MSESRELGVLMREFLRGLLNEPVARPDAARPDALSPGVGRTGIDWGPRVDSLKLRENFAPQKVEPYKATPGGIDNLALHSTDTFTIPGMGEFTVDFKGYFRVARSNPTTPDWATSEVLVNIIDLSLLGRHDNLGEIRVRLNPDIVSTGQIFQASQATTPAGGLAPKACRIATGAIFDIPKLGVTVFNKEPILLMNQNIKSIPPVNDPTGHALLFRVPLFNYKDPQGKAVAYLDSLKYGAEDYITEAEAKAFRQVI